MSQLETQINIFLLLSNEKNSFQHLLQITIVTLIGFQKAMRMNFCKEQKSRNLSGIALMFHYTKRLHQNF